VDAVTNPYSPGAGRVPAALVGRDREREVWRVALERVQLGRGVQPVALYGLRGVGKTVLLADFEKSAQRRHWITAKIEAAAGKSLREALGEALHDPLVDLARPSAGARLLKALKTAASFKASYDTSGTWSFGLDLTNTTGGGADTGVLETDLTKLIRDLTGAAEEEGVGLAILIDEAQDLTPDELNTICAIAHEAGQRQWPLMIALAGLPSLPRLLAEAKSYAERLFTYERIEELVDGLARDALLVPAGQEAVTWEEAAVDFTVNATRGYPYFLQQFGQDTWNEAPVSPITLVDARIGAAKANAALDSGFYRVRWDRANKSEKKYLRAMSIDGDTGSSSGAVATRLGLQPKSLGPTRANLISKGLIYAAEHGVVAFTVPGMADFIKHQPEN
jgi:DNA transposition AAA+ family ATPase